MKEPKSFSEKHFANYLTSVGLFWDYERTWGTHKPDFTVYSDSRKKNISMVIEIEDLDYNKEEKKILKEKGVLTRSFDPYQKIREKINTARRQLTSAKDFPCVLVIYNLVGLPPLPVIALGAMLGDLTINIPIDKVDLLKRKNHLSHLGKMGKC